VVVKDNFGCHNCPALVSSCEGDERGQASCAGLQGWIDVLGGLDLDVPLASQPAFDPSILSGQALPPFFPQLLNGLEVPAMIAREPVVGVGIAKTLTPRGKVSRRAIPLRYGPHDLRTQWGIGEETTVLCIGNTLDGYLEELWRAQDKENVWGRLQALGFDAATSLNFSIYLDQPRLEHLVNIKRSWLTVQRMQEMSRLIPIPHLQWATPLDLERQLDYAQAQEFHTLTLNLQMWKRQGWDTVAAGLAIIRERAPDLRLLITGVAGLKRMAELAEALPRASFTNTTAHYLAQRYVRLRRDGTRLIKEPVEGHPDLILAENVRLYREFLDEVRGNAREPESSPTPANPLGTAFNQVTSALQRRFGFDPAWVHNLFDQLAADETILKAFQVWLRTSELDREFRGSFPTWPCSDGVPHPTLGQLQDDGMTPLNAFLHLADLAHEVDEEIEVRVGQAGY
jgi:hypothetical protein